MTDVWVRHSDGRWRNRYRWWEQPSTPGNYPYVGSSTVSTGFPSWGAAIADINAKVGGLSVVRVFNGGGIGTWTSGNVATVNNGYNSSVWHSFKTWSEPQILAWMNGKPDNGRPAFLTFHHEPENDGWSDAQVLTWKQRVSRLIELRDSTGRDDIKCGPVLMRYTLAAGSQRDFWGDWYIGPPIPGKTPAGFPTDYQRQDFIGWDAYNQGSPNYSSPTAILNPIWSIATATGVPYAIGEFGSEKEPTDPTDDLRAAWAANYLQAVVDDGRCMVICYWNSTTIDSNGVITYDSRIFNTVDTWQPMVPFYAASRAHHGITYPKAA